VFSTLAELDAIVQDAPCAGFVIQKYVEDPAVIHGLKFDVRQFALVTSVQPLVVYMFGDYYLRFCTHAYSPADPTDLYVSSPTRGGFCSGLLTIATGMHT
jgi:hypothetical protein